MEQSPSLETNNFSAQQEVVHILRKPKVHYRVQINLSYVSSKTDRSCLRHSTYLLMINFNILESTPRSSEWPLSFRFPHQYPVYTSSLPNMCHMQRRKREMCEFLKPGVLDVRCYTLDGRFMNFGAVPIKVQVFQHEV
jgi:hypothetical protein